MKNETPYNPLDKRNLGISVADALLSRPIELLPPSEPFLGAGIYALYYVGNYASYQVISDLNKNNQFDQPIYVGKAVPAGARKGGFGLVISPGKVLYDRLREHVESINSAMNLILADFFCRYLVVDDIWIPLGESLLIEGYQPLWNSLIDGFGNHDPGSGRYSGQKPAWDVLHPGRSWANRLQPNKKSEQQLRLSIDNYISKRKGKLIGEHDVPDKNDEAFE